jgi:hypothetical protein
MTPADIDAAMLEILAEITELAGLSTYLGTSPETLSQDANLIIACGPLTTVAGPFSTCEISVILDSPALPGDLTTHNTRAAAIRAALADKASIASDFDSEACTLVGTHLARTDQRTQDERWIFEAVLAAGFTAI